MFFDNNPWLNYVDRDYDIIKSAIVTKLQNVTTGIPEITDHSQSNPFIRRVSIWAGIAEMLGYYIDNKGRESFLSSARLFNSIYKLANQYDYRIRGKIASTGEVKITLNANTSSDIIIPAETQFSTDEGLIFTSLNNVTILTGSDEAIVSVRQWEKIPISNVGTTTGNQNQIIVLSENVADNSVRIKVDGIAYLNVETFSLQISNDKVFRQQLNLDGKYSFQLSDGINGFLPVAGKIIEAEYFETTGLNVGATLITNLVTPLTLPAGISIKKITNEQATTNGKSSESIADLKKFIPLSLRTLYRAVTRQDYIDVTKLAPGVINAGVKYRCAKTVDVYIAPVGGGMATSVLLNDVAEFLDLRKMITTFINVYGAGLVYVEHKIKVRALPTYYNSEVEASVLANLEEHYSNENQKIGGVNYIGNIYQIIEDTKGVESSDLELLRPVPAALPQNPAQVYLDWNRQQTQSSSLARYRIQFVNTNDYKLFRNNTFLGTYSVGLTVTTTDLVFTINTAGYVPGDVYNFQTYLSVGNIKLNEPSLLSYDLQYISIDVIGGIN